MNTRQYLQLLPALIFATFILMAGAALAADIPAISDDEEYKIYAAVLFPDEPDIGPDTASGIKSDPRRRDLPFQSRPRLDGIGVNSPFLVIDEDTDPNQSLTSPTDGRDASLVRDFNLKNKTPGKILKEKLVPFLPKGQRVEILSAEARGRLFSSDAENRDGWDKFRRNYPFASGIVDFSRVGFNEQRTRAVVFVRNQAHYTIGVGYIVYLQKSDATGKWSMTGSQLAYMS